MPEGDTIRILADKISDRFAGDVVRRAALRDPRLVGADLVGRSLIEADAYGKHLFVRFDGAVTLHAHLLMTGSFRVGPPSREVEWKRRVELWLDRGRLTGESVPKLGLIATRAEADVTAPLGPDLCATAGPPDPGEVAARLVRAPDAPLTGALLDQTHVAGFGNVYVNDVPFVVGVDPFQPIGTVSGLAELVAIGTALIRTNVELGRQNTRGSRLDADARWVHGLGRRPCPVCGGRLSYLGERETPWGRSITWCPACQPPREVADVDLERTRRLIGLHPASRRPPFPGR